MRSHLAVHHHEDDEEHSPCIFLVCEHRTEAHEGEYQPDHCHDDHAEDEVDASIRDRREGEPTCNAADTGPSDLLNDVQ